MAIMPGYGFGANHGYLEADRTDPLPYAKTSSTAVDYDTVKNYLIQVLVANGLSIAQVPTSTLDALVQQFANNPDFQSVYNSASSLSSSLYPSTGTITGFMQNQLFDPSLSSNSDLLSSGLLLMSNQGRQLSTQQQASLGQYGGSSVSPFNFASAPPGLQYGQYDSVINQNTQWVEYETKAGTPIVSPFGGTISVVDTGTQGWGRRIFVHMSNGQVLSFGHLSSFALTSGNVQPGQIIGYTGGARGTAGAGNSTGPHVDIILQGPDGKYIDPSGIVNAWKTGKAIPGMSATSSASNIIQIITGVANSLGIDPAIALATAYLESKFNPNASGDNGHSIGLFQLHDRGEGAGMSVQQREDPVTNAQIALTQFARVRQQNPSVVNNPGLWAALAQRPADATDYANTVNSIFGDIKSGKLPTADLGAIGGAGLIDALKTKYPSAFSAYNQFFGQDPTAAQVAGLIAHGSDPAAVMNAIRAMPSHLRGLNQGQYTDLKSLTDGTSQTALGHASTDGIIAELFGKGLTSQADVQAWYDEQTPNQMNKNTYQAIYQANQPSLNSIYNTSGFDPRIATQQYNAAVQKVGGTPYAGPPTAGTPAPYKQRFGGLQA